MFGCEELPAEAVTVELDEVGASAAGALIASFKRHAGHNSPDAATPSGAPQRAHRRVSDMTTG
jgi:hypothetical protein